MKNFLDASGTEWTVFEVRRAVSAKGDWSYLPSGFSDGWLCFECSTAKKRLVRYPERWRELSDEQLVQLLGQAQPAPRGSMRLGDDLSGESGTARPDAHPE
ncbi:MAG TPA: hypothetical protein VJ867_13920 [Gemmatimonadaceae bacterium]|nr:hypothetical protein [Gemmatimonadaceae bacterium]